MKIKSTKLLLALLFISVVSLKAQQNVIRDEHNHEHIDPFSLSLNFDKDSLKGFNEQAAWQQAKMSTDQLWRQERLVALSKRDYIDHKYKLVAFAAPDPVVQQPCTNPNFENGTLSGWVASQSNNNNSLTMLPWTNQTTTNVNVVMQGQDNAIPLNRVPPGGGTYAVRLGPIGASSGGKSYRISQTFTVTPANSVFIYKYAVVLNRAPHNCAEQPFFNVSFKDCNGNPIPCGQYNVSAIGSACSSGGDPSFIAHNATWAYKPWTTAAFDLTAYIGQCVKLEFTVGGCVISQAAHGAYAYIDADCKPFTLNLNTVDIPIPQVNSSVCGSVGTNTLCAPPGFGYSWTGPGVTGQTGQCINATSIGTYSVTLDIPGTSCAFSPVLYTTFNATPNPTVTAAITQPTCVLPVGTATINTISGTPGYTYTWVPAAPSTSVNTNLPPGTPYTVTVRDANGCLGSTSFSVDPYPPAPDYTVSVSPSYSLTCLSPSTTITFSTNPGTTGAWFDPNGTQIIPTSSVITTPGVYTYSAMNTVSTCSLAATINITSNIVLPVVTPNVTQPSCAQVLGSATVTATGGDISGNPYVYNWVPNTVGTPNFESNENLAPGSSYTVNVTDNLGCTGTATFSINNFAGAALYTVTPVPGAHLTCTTPSVNLTVAPTNTNTSTSWAGPSGPVRGQDTIVTTAGVYTYTAINSVSSCSVVGTIDITVDKVLPTASTSVVCNGAITGIRGESTNPDVLLDWMLPTVPPTLLGNFQGNSSAVGVFTLIATNPNNGCVQTFTVTSVVPTVSITTVPSNNVLTCVTRTVTATTSSSATGTNVTVSWNNGVTTATVNPFNITAPGTYTTLVQIVNGCSSQSVVTITSNTVANVTINPTALMIPCATGTVGLNASSTVGGPYTYVWTPSSPSFTGTPYVVSDANTYNVVALNTVNGCTATVSQVITKESVTASFDASVYAGETPLPVTFTNTSVNSPGTDYTWNFANGSTSTVTPITSTIYDEKGTYDVVLTAVNGTCQDTAMRRIIVDMISFFEVPNVFTPNGDGRNDIFTFKSMNMGEITLTIFDRWGLKMFESTDRGNIKWDGKNKGGSTVTDGTYFYIIKAVGLDDKTYDLQGTVNVFQ